MHHDLETVPLILLFHFTLFFNVEVILHLTADITKLEISCVEFEFYNTSGRQKISERQKINETEIGETVQVFWHSKVINTSIVDTARGRSSTERYPRNFVYVCLRCKGK